MSLQVLNVSGVENPEITVVVPTMNLEEWRVRNCLWSLSVQSEKRVEVLVSDVNSGHSHLSALWKLCKRFDATMIHAEVPEWSISLAYNIGVRRAKGRFIATTDADIIFEYDAVRDTMRVFKENQDSYVVRQPVFLQEGYDCRNLSFPEAYSSLSAQPQIYVAPSVGSFTAVNRSWWMKVKGYDERMSLYGSEDWELWRRALRMRVPMRLVGEAKELQYPKTVPNPNCRLYHQWHPAFSERSGTPKMVVEKQKLVNREIYLGDQSIVRNQGKWGMIE